MQREQVHLLVDTLLDLGQSVLRRHALPTGARGHFRAARREVLLGVRALVDEAIAHTGAGRPAQAGSTKIPIDD